MTFAFTKVLLTRKQKLGTMDVTTNANVKKLFMATTDVTNGKCISTLSIYD